MSMASDSKEKLVRHLQQHAFDPVLRADSGYWPESKRDKLCNVQQATGNEVERFRNFEMAEDVVVNFKGDLHSDAARHVQGDLADMGLPTLHDVRDGFERLASELGVF